MYLDNYYPQTFLILSGLYPHLPPNVMTSSLFLTHQVQVLLFICTWVKGNFVENRKPAMGHTAAKNRLFPHSSWPPTAMTPQLGTGAQDHIDCPPILWFNSTLGILNGPLHLLEALFSFVNHFFILLIDWHNLHQNVHLEWSYPAWMGNACPLGHLSHWC